MLWELLLANNMTALAAPVNPFAPLSGSYSVGTTQFFWTDLARAEPYASDPLRKRKITVQVWYPTNKDVAAAPDAPYLLSPLEFSGPTQAAAEFRSFNERFSTNAFKDAPLAQHPDQFPILLFNPGGSMPRFTSSFVTQQLASNGYVVFAIEHYGDSKSTNYPDGSSFDFDMVPVFPDDGLKKRIDSNSVSTTEIIDFALKDWKTRDHLTFQPGLDDSRFTLKQITELNRSPGIFQNRLDLMKIGAIGWSQGGAEALNLLVHNDEVRAAVNLDGQLFGDDKSTLCTNKPFMNLHGEDSSKTDSPTLDEATKILTRYTTAWDNHLMDCSTGHRYSATIAEAGHGNFSDYIIFYSNNDPARRHKAREREQLIAQLAISFFDIHMLGRPGKLPLDDKLILKARALQ